MVYRFDTLQDVLAPSLRADGGMDVTATVARCGIYLYRRADGTMLRELVLPEHLFDAESLKTLAGVSVTANPPTGHPPGLVTAENAAQYAVGHVHDTIDAVDAPTVQDFGYVRVRYTARTKAAVDQLKAGGVKVSPGYAVPKYDATPGVHPVWGPYDAIQGPRIWNHLAQVDPRSAPRGGDQMMVHLDAADDVAYQVWPQEQAGPTRGDSKEKSMIRIRLDSIGREVELDPTTAEILRQELARRDSEMEAATAATTSATDKLAELKAAHDALKAKLDQAAADLEKAQGEKAAETAGKMDAIKRADALDATLKDPAKIRAILAPRIALETTARQVLAADQHARIDSLGDDELKREIIATRRPSLKLDAKIDVGPRLDGMYAMVIGDSRADAGEPPPRDPKATTAIEQAKTAPRMDALQAKADADAYIPPGKGPARKV